MKKAMGLVLMIFLFANLCACNSDDNYKNTGEQMADIGETIITSFKENDKETLISLFSENIKNSHDLDKEIERAFEFFDSEIIEYDEIHGSAGGGEMRGEEGLVKSEGTGFIDVIKTESGTNYTIGFQICLIDKDNEENIGLYQICIINQDMEDECGYVPERLCEIGEQ